MDITTQQPQQMSVPLSRLVRDEANVRKKYDSDSVASMKASILAHGIIQPLAVRPPQEGDRDLGGQLYRVFAGGRRLRALTELVEEKLIDPDLDIPIIVRDVDDRQASEMSLTENIIRRQMEPADEYRAFKELADKGMSVAEIALRFGQSERFVKGRLALANVHPDILAAFESGELSFEGVAAYTINPDQEAQAKFFHGAQQWARRNVHDIKAAMRNTGIRETSDLAEFIGREAYVAAGGHIHEDLFGDEVLWISDDLIENLKDEGIEKLKAEATADGWSFFATTEELGLYGLHQARVLRPEGSNLTDDEYARMEEISEQLEGYDPDDGVDEELDKLAVEYEALEQRSAIYTAEQKAVAGVVLDTRSFKWRVGVSKPGEDRQTSTASASPGAIQKEKDPLALTQPLRDLIGDTATAALRTAAIANPHKTLALIAAMLEQHEQHGGGVGKPSRLKVERVTYNHGDEPANKERPMKAAFNAYAKLEPDDLLTKVAQLFAPVIDLSEAWFQKDYTSDDRRVATRKDFLKSFSATPVSTFDPEILLRRLHQADDQRGDAGNGRARFFQAEEGRDGKGGGRGGEGVGLAAGTPAHQGLQDQEGGLSHPRTAHQHIINKRRKRR